MATISKMLNILAGAVELRQKINSLTTNVELLAKEMRDIDRRVIRLETFIEIAEKSRRIAVD